MIKYNPDATSKAAHYDAMNLKLERETMPVLFHVGDASKSIVVAMTDELKNLKDALKRIFPELRDDFKMLVYYRKISDRSIELTEDNLASSLRLIKERGCVDSIYVH